MNWFWIDAEGKMRGPYSLNEVIAAIRRGEIGEATRVSNDGCA